MPPIPPDKGDGDQYASCARRITTLLCGDAVVNGEETVSEWEVFVRRRVAPTSQPMPTNLPSLIALVTAAATSGVADPVSPPTTPPVATIPLRRRVTSKKPMRNNAAAARYSRRTPPADDNTAGSRSSSNSPERCADRPSPKSYSPSSDNSPVRDSRRRMSSPDRRNRAGPEKYDTSYGSVRTPDSPVLRPDSPVRGNPSPTPRSKRHERCQHFEDSRPWALECSGFRASQVPCEESTRPGSAVKPPLRGKQRRRFPCDQPRGTAPLAALDCGDASQSVKQQQATPDESSRVTVSEVRDSSQTVGEAKASDISYARGRARRRVSCRGGSESRRTLHAIAGPSGARRLGHSLEYGGDFDQNERNSVTYIPQAEKLCHEGIGSNASVERKPGTSDAVRGSHEVDRGEFHHESPSPNTLNNVRSDPSVSTSDGIRGRHLSLEKSPLYVCNPAHTSASVSTTLSLTHGTTQFRLRSLVDWLTSPWSQRLQKGSFSRPQDRFAESRFISDTIIDRCKTPTDLETPSPEETPGAKCSTENSCTESSALDEYTSSMDEDRTGDCNGGEEQHVENYDSSDDVVISQTGEIVEEVDAEDGNANPAPEQTQPRGRDEQFLYFEMATDSSLPGDGAPIPTVSMVVRRIDFVDSDDDSMTLPIDTDDESSTLTSATLDVESAQSSGSSSNLDTSDHAHTTEDYPTIDGTSTSPGRNIPRTAGVFSSSSRSRARRRARYVQRDALMMTAEEEMEAGPSVLGMLPAGYRESDDMLFAQRQRLAAAAVSLDRLFGVPEESAWTAMYRPAPLPLPIPEEIPPGSQPFLTSIASVVSSLECPICFAYMVKNMPILLCVNGHNVCGQCQRRVHTCPVCRGRLLFTRNLALEAIASDVEFRLPPPGQVGSSAPPVANVSGRGLQTLH